DTGIMDGPPIRYFVEGVDEWRTASTWPVPEARFQELFLRSDGALGSRLPDDGSRDYMVMPPTLVRPKNTNPPTMTGLLSWETAPMTEPMDLVGPAVLHLQAASTATDTDWIVRVSDVAPDGTVNPLTQGWLRASHRAVDEQRSRPWR